MPLVQDQLLDMFSSSACYHCAANAPNVLIMNYKKKHLEGNETNSYVCLYQLRRNDIYTHTISPTYSKICSLYEITVWSILWIHHPIQLYHSPNVSCITSRTFRWFNCMLKRWIVKRKWLDLEVVSSTMLPYQPNSLNICPNLTLTQKPITHETLYWHSHTLPFFCFRKACSRNHH